jgi:hypothetical protein
VIDARQYQCGIYLACSHGLTLSSIINLNISEMAAFYIVLKAGALLAIIIVPLIRSKTRKTENPSALSKFYVNENGFLEYVVTNKSHHHPVQ